MSPPTVNTQWGMVIEDNSFGSHELLRFAISSIILPISAPIWVQAAQKVRRAEPNTSTLTAPALWLSYAPPTVGSFHALFWGRQRFLEMERTYDSGRLCQPASRICGVLKELSGFTLKKDRQLGQRRRLSLDRNPHAQCSDKTHAGSLFTLL